MHYSILNILSSKFNQEIFSQLTSAETKHIQMNMQFHFPDLFWLVLIPHLVIY